MSSFYNTTNEPQDRRVVLNHLAEKQEDVIYEFYRMFGKASPSFVHSNCLKNAPLTSIRRAITNLTSQGKLVKTDVKVKGSYGRMEYVWRLAGDKRQLELL